MHRAATARSGRGASGSKTAFSGGYLVALRPSDVILEARRPRVGRPASVDGAVTTMATIVATRGPPDQVRGALLRPAEWLLL
jgi:hypothetical protein